jgi:hypothetical protein
VLAALWRENLNVRDGAEEKLRWCYLQTPAGRGAAFLLEHTMDAAAPAPVGCMGLARVRLYVHGQPVDGLQMIDLAVSRRHRTLFPSRQLQRAARAHAREAADLTYGVPNERAAGPVLSLGYRRVGVSRRYARPLRFGAYLARRLPQALVPAAAMAAQAADLVQLTARAAVVGLGARLVVRDQPGPAHDLLWRRARERHGVVGDRAAETLAWRLRRADAPLELITLRARRGDDVIGWAALETLGDTAHLRDLFAADGAGAGALVDMLLPELRARGATAVSFCYLGASWLPQALATRGFRARPETRVLIAEAGARGRIPDALLDDPESWYFTEYDEPG